MKWSHTISVLTEFNLNLQIFYEIFSHRKVAISKVQNQWSSLQLVMIQWRTKIGGGGGGRGWSPKLAWYSRVTKGYHTAYHVKNYLIDLPTSLMKWCNSRFISLFRIVSSSNQILHFFKRTWLAYIVKREIIWGFHFMAFQPLMCHSVTFKLGKLTQYT